MFTILSSVFFLFWDKYIRATLRKNSTNIYYNTIKQILKTDLNFFLTTPTSKILYRFIKDQNVLDEELVNSTQMSTESWFTSLITFIILACVSSGLTVFLVGIWLVLYFYLTRNWDDIVTKFFHMSYEKKSALISTLLQVLQGTVVMRSYNTPNFFNEKFFKINDDYQNAKTHYMNYSVRFANIRAS
jgi:ABC-type multidrug transport system fused ATPase/permease subunit